MTGKIVRTRIAPSPTGPLHIGTARSALFNFIFARQHKGAFVLRIEDTDLLRSDPVFEKDIQEGLKWLGIDWDEFYRQSERLDIYERYLRILFEKGSIFWCPHTEEELASERKEQMLAKEPLRHVCSARNGGNSNEVSEEILRFKNDAGEEIIFEDIVRGRISFNPGFLGDFSVAKNFRTPLYNFAVAIDDEEMQISHVIRGEDHISNTPKQILLQKALGFESPKYAHLPLILGADRSKLSKRHGATSVLEYRKSGYLPEAMINFMVLLGWRESSEEADKGESEKEIFSQKEILKKFSLDRVHKGGAIFNLEKLAWMNKEYIKNKNVKELASELKSFCGDFLDDIEKDNEKWTKIVSLIKARMTFLSEAGNMADFFYKEPFYPKELIFWKENSRPPDIARHLEKILALLAGLKDADWSKERLEASIMPYADENGRGEVLWPFRAALSGRRASPGPFEIAAVIGRKETVKRLEKAIAILK